MERYNFKKIEEKWQNFWVKNKSFKSEIFFQNPEASPARKATPSAVVSVVLGLTTLVCNKSD